MKLAPRHCVLKLLDRLDQSDAYADLLYESEMRRSQYSELDRALIQQIFYGTVRWRKRLEWIVSKFYQGNYGKAPRFVHYILDAACYQLLFLDKVPAYAVINEAVELGKKKGGKFWARKINAVLRAVQKGLPSVEYPDVDRDPIAAIAIRYSHPEWLVERWINQWGRDATLALCQANNVNPQLSIRVNRLKSEPAKLQEMLARDKITAQATEYLSDFLYVDHLTNLWNFSPFQQGYFSVQDVSAGLACQLLQPEPGERIIDLCA
ncbi:MAG: 16S rRNA (cytosine(967)-C(5))-methyltransferase RsmB, partial [candidate division KSB1 bacterium]|nr:16S rRNA (cytosine(967)-C(5))-methyltransferase RsmB [candidate division KSB1 bacterium]